MYLLKNFSVCIFESPRSVVLFNCACTNETALYNLNEIVHACDVYYTKMDSVEQGE